MIADNLISEAKLVSFLARINLDSNFENEIEELIKDVGIRPDKFLLFCQYHEVIPLVYNNLKRFNNQMAQCLLDLFKNQYYCDLAHTVYLENEYFNLIRILQARNIEFIPLKGIVFYKDIYPDINYRSMTDIDILVYENALEKIEEVLKEIGYEKELAGMNEDYWRKDHCHLIFRKDKVILEVHWDLSFKIPRKIEIPQLWERAKEMDFNGFRIKTLSPEDNIICLALHQRRFNKPLCWKNAFDLVALIDKYKDIDWDYLLETSYKNGMLSSVYFLLLQAKLVLETDISEKILSRFRIPYLKRKLMLKLIKENTFSEEVIMNFERRKSLYFKLNFLLYDNLFELLKYFFWIPQEKFAKYCQLKPYTPKTNLLYRMRFLYLPFRYSIERVFNQRL